MCAVFAIHRNRAMLILHRSSYRLTEKCRTTFAHARAHALSARLYCLYWTEVAGARHPPTYTLGIVRGIQIVRVSTLLLWAGDPRLRCCFFFTYLRIMLTSPPFF